MALFFGNWLVNLNVYVLRFQIRANIENSVIFIAAILFVNIIQTRNYGFTESLNISGQRKMVLIRLSVFHKFKQQAVIFAA